MCRIAFAGILVVLGGCACFTQSNSGEATRIEADQKTGVVRIISDNREVAYFDRRGGLHARDFTSQPVDELGEGR